MGYQITKKTKTLLNTSRGSKKNITKTPKTFISFPKQFPISIASAKLNYDEWVRIKS